MPLLFVVQGIWSGQDDIANWIVVALIGAVVIGVIGGADAAPRGVDHLVPSSRGVQRGPWREVLAVGLGAVIGSIVLAGLGAVFFGGPSAFIVVLILGIPVGGRLRDLGGRRMATDADCPCGERRVHSLN